ncbi:MAG TPA: isocitrate lyase [Candidatus Thermoplasmatota archaeon]|nr:isocitrate lyase [Candidatus Thermoplasmatota archaeon]
MTTDVAARMQKQAQVIQKDWDTDPRWKGVRRDHTAHDVVRLRGSLQFDYPVARHGAAKLWQLINEEKFVRALGALTGNQAIQMARAGLKAIYLSGWQVAADNNLAEQMYPDQSLYPANSVPSVVRRINNALRRADQIDWSEGKLERDWFIPILADAEAGFGGPLNAYELMKGMIEAGAAGVHWEDQLASEKKCGHLGGKVLIPTNQHVRTLKAARLAADVMGVSTLIVARTDARAATLLTSDVDANDAAHITGERTPEGYLRVKPGLEHAIARSVIYAPYADLLWCETSTPDMDEARRFAEAVHTKYPGKPLAYNCSPSFNWRKHLSDTQIAKFQDELGAMGYRFQFITLAGFHALNESMFELAHAYAREGMSAYVRLQDHEFGMEKSGYTATKHQREVGTGYFDEVYTAISGGTHSTKAMHGSTEHEQFHEETPKAKVAAQKGN